MGREWIGRWISIGGLLFRTVGRQFSHHKRLPSSTPSAPVVLCQEFLVLDSRIVSDQHGSQVRTEKKKRKKNLRTVFIDLPSPTPHPSTPMVVTLSLISIASPSLLPPACLSRKLFITIPVFSLPPILPHALADHTHTHMFHSS